MRDGTNKKILVTGGTGYIGSHTVVALYEAGYLPIIIDNLSNSNRHVAKQVSEIIGQEPELHVFDLCDKALLDSFVRDHPDITGVVHFAALKSMSESVTKPLLYYQNNLQSLFNLLQVFERKDVNFVFSSSCTVYGQPDKLPVSEEAPFKKAVSPYGHSKQVCEEILESTVNAQERLNVVSLRYFNPVGAHASGLIGELPLGVPQNLVPFISQSAIGKRGPIQVFGTDYDTPDGSAMRDYIHVVDLANAHVRALRYMEEQSKQVYDVFNIGTGKGVSVLEVIHAFEQATGVRLVYGYASRRPGDVEEVWGDVEKARRVLNWEAQLDLNSMMRSAWKWEQYLQQHPFASTK